MHNNSQKQRERGPDCTICLEREANVQSSPIQCTIDGCPHSFCLRCIKRWAKVRLITLRPKTTAPSADNASSTYSAKTKPLKSNPYPNASGTHDPEPLHPLSPLKISHTSPSWSTHSLSAIFTLLSLTSSPPTWCPIFRHWPLPFQEHTPSPKINDHLYFLLVSIFLTGLTSGYETSVLSLPWLSSTSLRNFLKPKTCVFL